MVAWTVKTSKLDTITESNIDSEGEESTQIRDGGTDHSKSDRSRSASVISDTSCFDSRSRSGSASRGRRSPSKGRRRLPRVESDGVSRYADNLSQVSTEYSRRSSNSSNASSLEPQPGSTALLLDWDDTLFPTTWLLDDAGIEWDKTLQEQLPPGGRCTYITTLMNNFEHKVAQFLLEASRTARIFIVTLSGKGWVERAIKTFMPRLSTIWEEACIEVIYTQEHASSNLQAAIESNQMQSGPANRTLDLFERLVEAKAEISFNVLKEHGTWRSVISIGDSDFEHYEAFQAVIDNRYLQDNLYVESDSMGKTAAVDEVSANGKPQPVVLLVKTLQFLDDPTAEELIAQLTMLRCWLPHLIMHEGCLQLEIENSEEDDSLMKLHKIITGHDEILSWSALAGMDSSEAIDFWTLAGEKKHDSCQAV